jgi:hypothetical protein
MAISSNLITSGSVDILTVPALTSYASLALIMCNYGISDETINVWAIPSGGTAINTTKIMSNFTLPAGNTYIFDTKMILGAGDKITIQGTAGGLVSVTTTYIAI